MHSLWDGEMHETSLQRESARACGERAATNSRRQAEARFNVCIATAIRRMGAVETSGTMAAQPQGLPRTSKLDSHEAYLRGVIDGKGDITLGRCAPGRGASVR